MFPQSTPDQVDLPLAAAQHLHQRHAGIVGLLPEAIGPFDKGSPYRANEVSALRWVHATLVEAGLMAHHLVLPALTVDERERYWTESRLFGALFGLTPADLPADWASFVVYNEAMVQSDILSVKHRGSRRRLPARSPTGGETSCAPGNIWPSKRMFRLGPLPSRVAGLFCVLVLS
jgi:hypothetical protein